MHQDVFAKCINEDWNSKLNSVFKKEHALYFRGISNQMCYLQMTDAETGSVHACVNMFVLFAPGLSPPL